MNEVTKTESRVAEYIAHQHLLNNGGRYIVALSGGADSVALLLIMRSRGVDVCAAHCNFHLRGEESDRDEKFCVDLCKKLDVNLHRIHFDTLTYAEKYKVSIEMAARNLRYGYFAQLAKDLQADGILVAHHRDDNVETVILNLLRGSGVDGLAGIAPKNGNIIRPLLCIGRDDILRYLGERHQDFVTDSTNLEDEALRNKIRHHVIPLLETINPAAKVSIASSAKYLRQAAEMLKDAGAETDITFQPLTATSQAIHICKMNISTAASPQFILHKLIGIYGFHGDVIEDILLNFDATGKVWQSNTHLLAMDREQLTIIPLSYISQQTKEREIHIPEEGCYTLSDDHKIHIRKYPRTPDFTPCKDANLITLDAAKARFPLTYRLTQTGDRLHPFGMKGSKLVSDYLTDKKRGYLEKKLQHVLTDADAEIIWLIGERTSELCKIDKNTREVLEIKIIAHYVLN